MESHHASFCILHTHTDILSLSASAQREAHVLYLPQYREKKKKWCYKEFVILYH